MPRVVAYMEGWYCLLHICLTGLIYYETMSCCLYSKLVLHHTYISYWTDLLYHNELHLYMAGWYCIIHICPTGLTYYATMTHSVIWQAGIHICPTGLT